MLRHAKRAFADHHPDPFDALSDEQRDAHKRKVEEFNALRSADRGLISEQPAAAKDDGRPSADVPRKEVNSATDSVDELLNRIRFEILALEPDPFHDRLTSSVEERLRADQNEVRWISQIIDRSLKANRPQRYFSVCVCKRYKISKTTTM